MFFFFSSRRRHTRLQGDWSSDVCSSDLVCHSADLIIQQRLDREKWTAIVNKMVHWGAQVSPSEQEVLLNYLATRYHPDAPPERRSAKGTSPGSALRGTASYPTGESRRGRALFAAHCLACHGVDAAGGIGPKLAANPILLEQERFWEIVLEGRRRDASLAGGTESAGDRRHPGVAQDA